MESSGTGLTRFVAELRRRHVFRSAVGWAAAVFVVLQIAEIVFPAFGIGDRVLRLLVMVGVVGFPVVVALAWVYEITPQGIRTMRELDEAEGRVEVEGSLLPRLALLGVTLVASVAAGIWWARSPAAGPSEASGVPAVEGDPAFQAAAGEADVPIRSLAVMPLEVFAPPGDTDQDDGSPGAYFAAGMQEALISRLSQLGSLRVISRTTVREYDPAGRSVAQIGQELGVEGIVEGSVLVDGDDVRITVQLIHAPSDSHVWAADYERRLEDIISLQREVATAIAEAILGELGDREQLDMVASSELPDADPEAALMEARGRTALDDGDPRSLDEAEEAFEQAVARDSTYAPALSGLAGLRFLRALEDGAPSADAVEEAGRTAARALEVDPTNREAREVLSVIRRITPMFAAPTDSVGGGLDVRIHVPGVDSMLLAEMEGDPFYGPATELGARLEAEGSRMMFDHRTQAAQGRLSAADGLVIGARGLASVGRTGAARDMLGRAIEASPGHAPAWDELERILVAEGALGEVVELRRDREESPAATGSDPAGLEAAVETGGVEGYWRWRLAEVERMRDGGEEVSPLQLARSYAALGRRDEALEQLERAVAAGDRGLATLRTDPTWDALRRDPRFGELLRRPPPPR